MKLNLILIGLLIGIVTNSVAQINRDFSVGVGFTPQWDGLMTNVYLNYHFNNRWQIGLMPLWRYESLQSDQVSHKEVFLGININSRLFIITGRRFTPYLYAFGGYIRESRRIEDLSGTYDSKYNHYDFSLGAGTQLNIGDSGWSLDLNLGYFWLMRPQLLWDFNSFIYSFGVIKKFE